MTLEDEIQDELDEIDARDAAPATEPPKRKRGRPRKTASGNPVLDGIIEKATSSPSASSTPRARAPKARAFGLGAGPAKSSKKKASGSAKKKSAKKSGASAKTPKAEPVKSTAQRERETKLSVLQSLEREFNAHNIQEYLSGVLRGPSIWDGKCGGYVACKLEPYEVTTAEARELGELLGLELQLEAKRDQFLARVRREIQAAEDAERKGAAPEGGAR